ncbi:MAG TPA: trehalose-phosphatase, partial [Longimicrobiales bacterium]|nr:trehalose-phosphatase [Longimicrobiales bacterium]
EMWGNHGWERRRPGGAVERADPGPGARQGLQEALEAARREAPEGAVEVKPASVAVHVRAMAERDAAEMLEPIRTSWAAVAGQAGLELHDFDGGVELRVPGRDKGTAVEAILEGSAAGAAAAYLGDDRTDEDAFRALRGRGLAVLVRDRLRETAADLWIRPPDELLAFLERWNSAASAE